MITRTARLPRPFAPDLADKQIADRFKGQFMIHRVLWETQAVRELERIYLLPSATEMDCAAQSPEQSTRTQEQGE